MMERKNNPDLAETVCCICDDGGDVIYCDGHCLRSFHLSNEASLCPGLGLSEAEVKHMDKFFCHNCTLNIHQCFACGRLGRSNGDAQEVFLCKADMCGCFYHASCVAKLILNVKDDTDNAYVAMVKSIRAGRLAFSCPRHKCRKCGGEEETDVWELQFGVCRRCPRVWHRKCLPRPVVFPEANGPQRAWDDLLPNRILVYCERHPIISELGTPARNHVKFPVGFKWSSPEEVSKSKAQNREQIRTTSELFPGALRPNSQKNVLKKGGKGHDMVKLTPLTLKRRERASLENMALARQKTATLLGHITRERLKPSLLVRKDKPALCGVLSTNLEDNSLPCENPIPIGFKSQPPAVFLIKRNTNVVLSLSKEEVSNTKEDIENGNNSKLTSSAKSPYSDPKQRVRKRISKTVKSINHQLLQNNPFLEGKTATLDIEAKSMVSGIIERAKLSISLDDVKRKHAVPACYKRSIVNLDEKYIMAKVESMVTEVRRASEILIKGGTVEAAKASCSTNSIEFIQTCQKDLNVYLCPFLHGSRYTSFGRHFTNLDKLAEIVERLHWYIQEGDTVADFCCGSNHFSLLMKQKLEQTGKSCDYRNFDLFQTKNDFNFTKGDWFDVKQDQLPEGNRLVMGLNPPFALANQFIWHALKFNPKLLVLIVPKETERPGQRYGPYNLIWEDNVLLAGKSFHLPGSVGVDNQTLEDWNINAPFLYMWSRPDWTFRHQEIAFDKGHIGICSKSSYVGSQLHITSLQIPSLSDSGLEDTVEDTTGDMVSDALHDETNVINLTLNKRESLLLMSEEPTIVNVTFNEDEAGGNPGFISLMADGNAEPLECKNVEEDDVGCAEVPFSTSHEHQNSSLVEIENLPKASLFEGCGNKTSKIFENARKNLYALLERPMPNFESHHNIDVCGQEEMVEPNVFTDDNNRSMRAFKEHLPSMERARRTFRKQDTLNVDVLLSMETVNRARETHTRQDSWDINAKELPHMETVDRARETPTRLDALDVDIRMRPSMETVNLARETPTRQYSSDINVRKLPTVDGARESATRQRQDTWDVDVSKVPNNYHEQRVFKERLFTMETGDRAKETPTRQDTLNADVRKLPSMETVDRARETPVRQGTLNFDLRNLPSKETVDRARETPTRQDTLNVDVKKLPHSKSVKRTRETHTTHTRQDAWDVDVRKLETVDGAREIRTKQDTWDVDERKLPNNYHEERGAQERSLPCTMAGERQRVSQGNFFISPVAKSTHGNWNKQPSSAFKGHLPSMEIENCTTESPTRQDTLDANGWDLPNKYNEQRGAAKRSLPSLMASELQMVSKGNLFDGSVAKSSNENRRQTCEHSITVQSNPVSLKENWPSKTLYRPQQGPASMWKQDTQNMQISGAHADNSITMLKRNVPCSGPEVPRKMFGLQDSRNRRGPYGMPSTIQGHLGPRGGEVGAFPHNALQAPPSRSGRRASPSCYELQAPVTTQGPLNPKSGVGAFPHNGLQALPSHNGLQAPTTLGPLGPRGGVGAFPHIGLQAPPTTQGPLAPRGGGVGAFPQNGLQAPPSHSGLQAPHGYSPTPPSHNVIRAPHGLPPRGWAGMARPGVAPVRSPAVGTFCPQYRVPSSLQDPSRLPGGHDMMVGGHAGQLQSSMLGCPASQRLPGQAYRHAF